MQNESKSWLKTFINRHFVPRGILFFHSPYVGEHDQTLTFPIKAKTFNETSSLSCCPNSWKSFKECQGECSASCCTNFLKWYLGRNEHEGSDEFLENARNIVIQEKQIKVDNRRQKNLTEQKMRRKKRIKDMSNSIKSIESNIDTFKRSFSDTSLQSK